LFNRCVSPPELDDKQLLVYLDGGVDKEVVSHLERCGYCFERANALARLQNRLTSRLYRINCPSSLELGEYQLRMLPASQMLVIGQHVRECPHCAREIAQLEEFFLSDLAPTENNLFGQAKVLIARLVGGSAGESTPAFAALRGEAKGPITLETDGIVIVLDVQPTNEGKVNILGQVAADDQDQWTEALVELRQGGELEFSTTVDDLGAFHSEGIMPGSKELRIIAKDSSRIVVSNFEVPT
jgi:hypothetical protein